MFKAKRIHKPFLILACISILVLAGRFLELLPYIDEPVNTIVDLATVAAIGYLIFYVFHLIAGRPELVITSNTNKLFYSRKSLAVSYHLFDINMITYRFEEIYSYTETERHFIIRGRIEKGKEKLGGVERTEIDEVKIPKIFSNMDYFRTWLDENQTGAG